MAERGRAKTSLRLYRICQAMGARDSWLLESNDMTDPYPFAL